MTVMVISRLAKGRRGLGFHHRSYLYAELPESDLLAYRLIEYPSSVFLYFLIRCYVKINIISVFCRLKANNVTVI